jgi:hypothetical protein
VQGYGEQIWGTLKWASNHKILKVNRNGTVHLYVGLVTDTINIRHINPRRKLKAPSMEERAICNFPRRRDKLMTELMNHKRSTS